MAANSKVNRIAGLSLAAAVAGTLTLMPVAKAQTTSPSSETATSQAPVVSTENSSSASASASTVAPASESVSTTIKLGDGLEEAPKASSSVAPTTTPSTDWAEILKSFAALVVPATTTGSGTNDATFTSDNNTYSALASNPTNGRLYAISNEGHLLRIHPQTGNLKDLGKVPDLDASKITSAAFTNDGTFVLIDGDTVYTKDLADDETGETATPDNLDFVKKPVDTTLPELAWAPTQQPGELVALSAKDGKATSYTLDVKDEKATVTKAPAEVAKGVDLAKLKTFNYAYLDDDATYFADENGHAVKLEDGKVTAVEDGLTKEDNYKAVAGLKPKPAATNTSTATSAEPKPADTVELNVAVTTDDGRAIEGATFKSADGTVTGTTDSKGHGTVSLAVNEASRNKDSFQLTLAEAPEGFKNTEIQVKRGQKDAKLVLPAEGAKNTTTKPTGAANADDLIEIDVLVKTADDKVVEGAEFKSEDGRVIGTTDADGRGKIGIDLNKDSRDKKLIQLTLKEAPKGYKNAEVVIRRGEGKTELVLPRDPKATPSSTLSKPDQVLKVIDQIKPVASSFLAPAAAFAGAAGMAGAGGKSTKSTKTTFGGTSVTISNTAGRSTGRSTSVTPSAKVVTRNGSNATVAKANSTTGAKSTAKTSTSDERDGDLADTGTPMRAVIALGVLSILVGGAYLALGRRREN